MFGNRQQGSVAVIILVAIFSLTCWWAVFSYFGKGDLEDWKRRATTAEAAVDALTKEKEQLEKDKKMLEDLARDKGLIVDEAKTKEDDAKKSAEDSKSERQRLIEEIENNPMLTAAPPVILRSASVSTAKKPIEFKPATKEEAILLIEYDSLLKGVDRVNKSAGK